MSGPTMYRGSKSQQSLTECRVVFADGDPTTVREASRMGQWVEARPPIRRPKQSSNWNVRKMERQSLPPMREHVASALVGANDLADVGVDLYHLLRLSIPARPVQ